MLKFEEIMSLDICRNVCIRNIERISNIENKDENRNPFDNIQVWKNKLNLIEDRLNQLVLTL
jgi:pectate lyase